MEKQIPVRYVNCNPSDDALACGLADWLVKQEHQGTMDDELQRTILIARRFMAATELVYAVHLSALGLVCEEIDDALNNAELWRDGSEHVIVYRHAGVFTRFIHDDNRQAEVEFQILRQDGLPL